MNVTAITCFCGRHRNVERVMRHFLDQDYTEQHFLLLYNNSKHVQDIDLEAISKEIPPNSKKYIQLVGNWKDLRTGKEYTDTGSIFRDALSLVGDDTDVITFMDSDDSFLPNHISAGVSGMKKAQQLGCLAYKPYNSYFLYENKCRLLHNTLEPSIFVDYKYLKQEGFHPTTVTYHQKWIDILIARKQLFVDPEGIPTLLYNWQQDHGNHKISGGSDDGLNFEAHRKWETDYGDGILTPAPPIEAQYFYRLASKTI